MQNWLEQLDLSHWSAHLISLMAWAGAVMGIFPATAGFAAFIYYVIQIYESPTAKKHLRRWRERRILAKVAKLKANEVQLQKLLDVLKAHEKADKH
jgi:hypothetical protein